jgi:hypothetical protein
MQGDPDSRGSAHRDQPMGEEPVEVTPTEAKQGTGPRDMLAVLIVPLIIAGVVGGGLLAHFRLGGS